MTASFNKPVLIAGGGIGGLAAALALSKRGFSCQIFERRGEPSEEGAGIQIGPNGTRILAEIGGLEALRPNAAKPEALQVRDARTGDLIARLPLGSWIEQRHGSPYWTAHRQDLHAALLQTAQGTANITVSFDSAVDAATDSPDGVTVRLGNGRDIEGAALIAADGLWSGVRSKLFRSSTPHGAGKNAYRTVVESGELPAGLVHQDVHIWLTKGAHVVHYPVRAGRQHAFVIILDEPALSQGWHAGVPAATVRAKALNLAPSLRALLEAGREWRMWSLQEVEMPPQWTSGHVALLGDAAHPVLPFLAQGAVLALEDAFVLAALAGEAGSVTAGNLRRYEELRRPRALRVQAASRRNGRIYHLDGLLAAGRDRVLRATPPSLIMRQYDWLYGWRHTS